MPASTVANSHTFEVILPSDQEVTLTRLFDAPRQLVFDALTKCEHVKRWWGCLTDKHGVSSCQIDLRIGGAWRFIAYGPEGDYPAFYGVFKEIAAPERLVYTETFEPFPDGDSLVTTVLTEERGKTRLTITAAYPTKEVRDEVMKTGMTDGAAKSYDRLEALVAGIQGK